MAFTLFSVSSALSSVTMDNQELASLTEDTSIWGMFGKKDSNLLRAKLWKLFDDSKLSNEARFMVFYLFAVIKNRSRVLNSIDTLPEEIKSLKSMTMAKSFIMDHLVQYTDQETNRKFAVVHLPTTMPGLDLLATALFLPVGDSSVQNYIIPKQTFAQIHLNAELQSKNRVFQQTFWNETVKTSKNEARRNNTKEELKFHEDYYKNSSSDMYKLLDFQMAEVEPENQATGYTEKEVISWFNKVKASQASSQKRVSKKPNVQ